MFCPKCGSNQGEGRKFCTSCGTNLSVVSQALTGNFPPVQQPLPPRLHRRSREQEFSRGLSLAIIGGGIMAGRLITYLITGFHGDSPFGFLGFIGFILLAVGVARIISFRAQNDAPAAPGPQTFTEFSQTPPGIAPAPPHPVFSAASGAASDAYEAPRTSELEPVDPQPSVTEAETQTLPRHSPPPEIPR